MKKLLLNAEVLERSFKLGLGEDIWYNLDYQDTDGKARNTVQYGKDVDEACRKLGIDWLEV